MLSGKSSPQHQKIASKLYLQIVDISKHHKCSAFFAPFDVRLVKDKKEDNNIYTVVQPDICVICDEEKIDTRGCVGAPDLVIEILSPYTAKKDLNEKYNLYEENGVKEYWVVFPDTNAINQYILKEGVYEFNEPIFMNGSITSSIFPGLTIQLKEIF